MGLREKKYVEISHLTYENAEEFGITPEQLYFITDLMYRSPIDVHNMILDKLFVDGNAAVNYKLTKSEAAKLITNLLNDDEFLFIEYDSPEWHKIKLEEAILGLNKDYVDYGLLEPKKNRA